MVAAVTSDNASTRINSGSTMLASNFETFLTLLTTQMKNQDPLSPLDSNEFTAQLTQMAGVEQQLLTNDLLTSLLKAQSAGGLDNAANYIGKNVTAAWTATQLEGGKATWSYELASNAENVTLQVLDSKGTVVWEGAGPDKTSGLHSFTWNGQLKGGGDVADDGGVYTLKVAATDSAGAKVGAQTLIQGRVTGVEMYKGEPYLVIGDSILPLSTVISLNEITTKASNSGDTENPNVPTEEAAA
ncbi:flagellar hook capping FlgD N-terminal domain-containing protein [Brevundimonas sp.]|uniref:flagellar hook assembly protein FlgD n=1 Tax=Brevundimonas sp. TaxID=1871086 RepID=UPI001AD0D1D0|nr:flagellar hook capping FlgD N-terminal domain-containing protein [Brevundimonas sp.]MBN9465292.1 flagellar hook capping protein [Brevundimonas sp.]